MKSILALSLCISLVYCLPPPHPAVVAVRREEELLPPYLRSPAHYNHRLQELLSLTSLLHHGEMVVHEREAEKVPRREIYKLLTHGGFIPRRVHQQPAPRYQAQHHDHRPGQHYAPNYQNFYDPPFFSSPELLQHL